jgi:cell division protein ZapA
MNARTEPTAVEIYGQTYNVRGEGDPAYLMELAKFVDSRMHSVSSQVASTDPMRIAILAALNIADEYLRYREQRESSRGVWMEKTEELAERLETTVAAAGPQGSTNRSETLRGS